MCTPLAGGVIVPGALRQESADHYLLRHTATRTSEPVTPALILKREERGMKLSESRSCAGSRYSPLYGRSSSEIED